MAIKLSKPKMNISVAEDYEKNDHILCVEVSPGQRSCSPEYITKVAVSTGPGSPSVVFAKPTKDSLMQETVELMELEITMLNERLDKLEKEVCNQHIGESLRNDHRQFSPKSYAEYHGQYETNFGIDMASRREHFALAMANSVSKSIIENSLAAAQPPILPSLSARIIGFDPAKPTLSETITDKLKDLNPWKK